jgi:hypothetical protein
MRMKSDIERLDDWEALCNWLEDRAYNASYNPKCRGAYLLSGPWPSRRTITVDDLDTPPLRIGGHEVRRKKDIPNPDYAQERARAKEYRAIVAERSRLQLVFWSSGHGWRLHKDYREKIAAERARLAALSDA